MLTIRNFYKYINKPIIINTLIGEAMLVIPRVVCGLLLALDFGASKFGMPWSPKENDLQLFEVVDWFVQDVSSYGGIFATWPLFFAWMGAFSEAVGGLFIALGYNTRLFSLLLLCTMLVAIFSQQFDKGMWQMLPAMGFLWVSIFYLVMGSGRYGIDYVIDKRMG